MRRKSLKFPQIYCRECKKKFGKELGVQVWEAINLVFDALPLAACIDNKVRSGQLLDFVKFAEVVGIKIFVTRVSVIEVFVIKVSAIRVFIVKVSAIKVFVFISCRFQIFCVHGGIPLPSHGGGMIAEINKLPVGLRQPMDEELAWGLLWNDPLRFVYQTIY